MKAARQLNGYIDLHSHTDESDGTLTPGDLIEHAKEIGLEALAITDHDTLAGYQKALPFARRARLDLLCGIELNTKISLEHLQNHRSVHLLAYFPSGEPAKPFHEWLEQERVARRERNQRLSESLQSQGVDVRLEEVQKLGRSLAGRPHFARILVQKGYASNFEEAFGKYLGESAPTFVERESKFAEEVIALVRDCDGVPVVAHPIRLGLEREQERKLLLRYRDAGLLGLEIYHSEHGPELQAYYRQLAQELQLIPTGGSDFHGAAKPNVELGTGVNGNVRVPDSFLTALRERQTV